MPTSIPLHIEIPNYIFLYLEPLDIYRRLVVSRVWHAQAEAQPYNDVFLDANYRLCIPLFSAFKTQRYLLRSFRWENVGARSASPQFDLLDFLLDYRPHDTAGNNQDDPSGDISLDGGHSIHDDNDSGEDDPDEYNSNSSEHLNNSNRPLQTNLDLTDPSH